ncbi:PP2C family protein-serine/threonine phosphatase [Phaeacidiphilus oryzae]|uniref:PP2C family protein-serine/threonine phosphatase n=1 Tax=Phaeacidiphilus oryzae TaxID=348818 RepID=UPI00389A472C
MPLGLQALSPEPRSAHSFALPAGSVLLLFTDGVTEARAPGGAFYPLEERLSAWSAERLRTDELLARMESDVEAYTHGRQRDDITVLAIERAPAQSPRPGSLRLPPGRPRRPPRRSSAASWRPASGELTRPSCPPCPSGPRAASCGRPGPVRT